MSSDSEGVDQPAAARARELLHRLAAGAERRIDDVRLRRHADTVPQDLRIVPYLGHGTAAEVVVRARVVDDPEPPEALPDESPWTTIRRTIARFETDELIGVPLRVTFGEASIETTSDEEGYVDVRLEAPGPVAATDGWAPATIELATTYRGVDPDPIHTVHAPVRMTDDATGIGIISDVDDTILQTGAQRFLDMVRTTITGTALTRTPFAGVAELYRAVADRADGPARPVFYVSSSPWNLHGFLTAFLRHRGIPLGPLLLRDLGIDEVKFIKGGHGEHKLGRIREVMRLHPHLEFVLVGDSGQHDPQIYAQVTAEFPDRVAAVWIREVRLDPGDGRVERVVPRFDKAGVPFLLAADSDVAAAHAVDLGLLDEPAAARVRRAVAGERAQDRDDPDPDGDRSDRGDGNDRDDGVS